MPQYKIRPGESFRDTDGTVKRGGELIELDEQMAALHRDKVDPADAESQPQPPQA